MIVFIVLVLSILALMWGYVGSSLLWDISSNSIYHGFVSLFLVATISLQFWRILNMRNPKANFNLINAAYFSLGLFCQLFVATATQDFLSIFHPSSAILDLALIFIAFGVNWQSLRIAKKGPSIGAASVNSGQNQKALRIVQISDLHVGPIIQTKYVEDVVTKINLLNPDIVVATGDIGDGDSDKLSVHLEPLRKISAGIPKFYIPGNHEYYTSILAQDSGAHQCVWEPKPRLLVWIFGS